MSKYTSKTLIKYIILAGIASFVIIFLIMQFTSGFDYNQLGKSISKINWWWVVAAAGTNLVSFVFEALQLVFLSSAIGKKLGFWRAMQIYFVGNFFSNATPSTSGGEPFQIYFLQDDGFTIAESTVMVMIRGLISIMVRLVFVIVIVVAVVTFGFKMPEGYEAINIIFYTTIIGYMILFLIGLFCIIYPTIFAFIVKFLSKFKLIRKLLKANTKEECVEKGMLFLHEIRSAALLLLKGKKTSVLLAIFNSIVTWALLKTMPFFVLLALNESANIFIVFAFGVISQLATAWVPTPGAVGGIELGMGLFTTLMSDKTNGGIFILIYRFMDYHMDVAIGGPIALSLLFRKLGKGAANKDLSQITDKIEEQMDLEKEHELSKHSMQFTQQSQSKER